MQRITLIILLFTTISLQSQTTTTIDSVYTWKKLNRRLSFAQMTFGGDVLMMSGATRTRDAQTTRFGPGFMPRVTIGGMHFWGHADFYVTFPLGVAVQPKPSGIAKYNYRETVETGMKIYPLAMRPGRISPYVGISFQPIGFGYLDEGQNSKYGLPKYERFITPIQAGLTYTSSRYLFTAGVRYNRRNTFDYHYAANGVDQIQLQPFNFTLGMLRYIDTDRSMGSPRSVGQQNLLYQILDKHHKLSTWYCGIGPSTALQMSKSPFFKEDYSYLYDEMLSSFLVPDMTIGYHFSKPDINVGIAGRTMAFKTGAFDNQFKAGRSVLSLEAYKFLLDYHGFVPFVGPMLSLEHLTFSQNGERLAASTKPAVGVVFGWDIRVTKTGTSLLRTNLRYTPGLHLDVNGKKVMYDHLEFNFIQMVKFIGRKKVYSQYRK